MNQYSQENNAEGDIYAVQGKNGKIVVRNQFGESRHALSWTLVVLVLVDVAFFFPHPAAAMTRTSTSRMLRIWGDLRRMERSFELDIYWSRG